MVKQTVEALIEGGKATAAPPLGPALGPLGVNIGQIVADINKKTADFKGMQVPVKVIVDSETKKHEITVGTPPASALIKKEAGVDKGASNPLTDKIADLKIEQIIKIAKMKSDSLLGKTNIEKAKEIIGTCNSMGILVEGKPAFETIKAINEGQFVDKIKAGKTELSAEELKELEEEKKKLAEEMEKRKEEFEAKIKEIMEAMKGKPASEIKAKLVEAEIPSPMIKEAIATIAPAPAAEGEGEAPKEGEAAAPADKKEE